MRAYPFAIASMLAVAGISHSPLRGHEGPGDDGGDRGDSSGTGSIQGTFASFERVKTRGATSERDVVVYLVSDSRTEHAPPATPPVVSQEKLEFSPHVLPVLAGSTVVFRNLDGVTHNVFSAEDCCSMDIDMESGGPETTRKFTEPCVVSAVCRLHPDMSLWIVVLDNPWFTHVELEKVEQGDDKVYTSAFEIAGVPPGTYTLTFWNKALKPQEYEVTVEPGKATSFDVTIAKQ